MTGVPKVDTCAICVQPRNSPRCPHPWHLHFDRWPADLRAKLQKLVAGSRREA